MRINMSVINAYVCVLEEEEGERERERERGFKGLMQTFNGDAQISKIKNKKINNMKQKKMSSEKSFLY